MCSVSSGPREERRTAYFGAGARSFCSSAASTQLQCQRQPRSSVCSITGSFSRCKIRHTRSTHRRERTELKRQLQLSMASFDAVEARRVVLQRPAPNWCEHTVDERFELDAAILALQIALARRSISARVSELRECLYLIRPLHSCSRCNDWNAQVDLQLDEDGLVMMAEQTSEGSSCASVVLP